MNKFYFVVVLFKKEEWFLILRFVDFWGLIWFFFWIGYYFEIVVEFWYDIDIVRVGFDSCDLIDKVWILVCLVVLLCKIVVSFFVFKGLFCLGKCI